MSRCDICKLPILDKEKVINIPGMVRHVSQQLCVERLQEINRRLELAVRNKLGDDLCWMDGIEVKPLPKAEMMESCSRYIDQLLAGQQPLCAGQMTIAQLEGRILELEEQVRTMGNSRPDRP